MRTYRTSSHPRSGTRRFGRIASASVIVIGLVAGGALLSGAPASAATTDVPITGSSALVNVLATPNGSTVYAVSLFTSTVTAIDAATRAITATIPVGSFPTAMAITADSSTLYVGNQLGESISVIDTATNQVTRTIQLANDVNGLAISPDGQTLYATSINDNIVMVVDAASGSIISTIPVGAGPLGLVATPDGSAVYVTLAFDNELQVISTATNTITQTIPVGASPSGVAVSPDGSTIYAAIGSDDGVAAIDTSTNTVTHLITVGSSPDSVAVSSDGAAVYASNGAGNTMSEISTATNTEIATYPTGAFPNRVAVSPDGLTAYTANETDNSVSIIDLAPPAAAVIAAGTPTAGTVGSAYSFTVPATGNPAPTFSVTTGTLPDGLALDPATGAISGTPTASGATTVIVAATNGIGVASTKSYTFTINPAPSAPAITSGTPTAAQVGSPYSFTVTATGSPRPSFSVTSGALPPGLSLDATTGAITGTPTAAGVSVFQISATNGLGVAAVGNYQVTTAAAAAVDPTTPTAVVLGTTGVDPLPAGIFGGVVILAGASLLVLRRRRRERFNGGF